MAGSKGRKSVSSHMGGDGREYGKVRKAPLPQGTRKSKGERKGK